MQKVFLSKRMKLYSVDFGPHMEASSYPVSQLHCYHSASKSFVFSLSHCYSFIFYRAEFYWTVISVLNTAVQKLLIFLRMVIKFQGIKLNSLAFRLYSEYIQLKFHNSPSCVCILWRVPCAPELTLVRNIIVYLNIERTCETICFMSLNPPDHLSAKISAFTEVPTIAQAYLFSCTWLPSNL